MATLNLISKSLGDIIVSSGNGIPDHTLPKGSLYTNKDTGILHTNMDGVSGWTSLNSMSLGAIYTQGNTSAIAITNQDWYSASGLTWTTGSLNGFTNTNGTLVLTAGRDGKYEMIGNATIEYNAATAHIEVGLSKNGVDPANGDYGGCSVTSTIDTAGVSITSTMDLVAGDTVEMCVSAVAGTTDILIRHGGIIGTRIGD